MVAFKCKQHNVRLNLPTLQNCLLSSIASQEKNINLVSLEINNKKKYIFKIAPTTHDLTLQSLFTWRKTKIQPGEGRVPPSRTKSTSSLYRPLPRKTEPLRTTARGGTGRRRWCCRSHPRSRPALGTRIATQRRPTPPRPPPGRPGPGGGGRVVKPLSRPRPRPRTAARPSSWAWAAAWAAPSPSARPTPTRWSAASSSWPTRRTRWSSASWPCPAGASRRRPCRCSYCRPAASPGSPSRPPSTPARCVTTTPGAH